MRLRHINPRDPRIPPSLASPPIDAFALHLPHSRDNHHLVIRADGALRIPDELDLANPAFWLGDGRRGRCKVRGGLERGVGVRGQVGCDGRGRPEGDEVDVAAELPGSRGERVGRACDGDLGRVWLGRHRCVLVKLI